jgi:hypothetical protein
METKQTAWMLFILHDVPGTVQNKNPEIEIKTLS